MRFQPAVGNRPMHRRAVFVDVATRAQECMVDRADSYPASMIGPGPRADIGQTLAPTHALTKRLYSVMLLTQFLS